jgi:ribonuclease HI
MEVFDTACWAIRVALQLSVATAEALQAHRVTTVAVLGDVQAAIRLMAHVDPGPGQQLARAINEHARTFCADTIEAVIHLVPEHFGISGNEEADHLVNT